MRRSIRSRTSCRRRRRSRAKSRTLRPGTAARRTSPAPVIDKLNAAVRASLAKPETKEKLKALGAITQGGSSPAEFRAWLQTDAERWARVIKAAGVRAE